MTDMTEHNRRGFGGATGDTGTGDTGTGALGTGARRALIAIAVAVLCILPFVASNFLMFQLTMLLSVSIAVMGLNVIVGYGGQTSLGHGAIYAIGAYSTAILMESFGVNWLIAVLLAAAISFVFGLLFGWPALRLKGHHLALATFALALAMPQVLKNDAIAEWTGGVQGVLVFGPSAPAWTGLSHSAFLYLVVLVFFLLALIMLQGLYSSRMGRAVIAVKENQIAAASMGVHVTGTKLFNFAISCMLTGLAGALFTLITEFVTPDSFSIMLSIFFLVAVVVGGAGTLLGPIIGALFIQFVPNVAENISTSATSAIYAALLLGVVFFFPRGAVGLAQSLTRRFGR